MSSLLMLLNDLASTIAKGKINFKKTPKERLTKGYIETRLELLEQQWAKFVDIHQQVLCTMKKDELEKSSYFCDDVHGEVEDTYVEYKTLLREMLSGLVKLNSISNNSTTKDVVPGKLHVKLPDIILPKFSGRYSEWPNFKDLFMSLIHNNKTLDDVQRLHYLKGSLLGEAETLCKGISITSDNYAICWKKLESRYSNKRLMVNVLLKQLINQKPISNGSANAIRALADNTNESLQALKNLGIDVSSWDAILVFIVSHKLDHDSRERWESRLSELEDDIPSYEELDKFMDMRFRALEYKTDKPATTSKNVHAHAVAASATSTHANCLFCKEGHKLTSCKKFINEPVQERRQFVKTHRLCFNCLSASHNAYACKVTTRCCFCKKRHHSHLHESVEQVQESLPKVDKEVVSTSCVYQGNTVLLATARVNVSAHDQSGSATPLRALIDQGSQVSFISESAVKMLNLPRIKEKMKVKGVGKVTLDSISVVCVDVASWTDKTVSLQVKAHVLPKLTALLPQSKILIQNRKLEEFQSLCLADPEFNQPNRIDMILGAEVYSKILKQGLIKTKDESAIAQATSLGWILSGTVERSSTHEKQIGCHTITCEVIETEDDLLKKFWEMESEPDVKKILLTKEEEACEQLFDATTKRDQSGRYIVCLPFKSGEIKCKKGRSKEIAFQRFQGLERRLQRDPHLKKEYSKTIQEYLEMGHMEVCDDEENPDAVYLPHHAVVREDKVTTKVRVVFDASCKGINGASLNSDLMVGPRLQPELRHLVMKWRCYPIPLVADIVKMYRQVKVSRDDADYQRIIWREEPNEPLKHFRLLRVTFGTSAAPYLAVRSLQQVAKDEGSEFPMTAPRILSDFYMDDFMSGCHSVEEGIQIHKEITEMLARGGFPLQKWATSNEELSQHIVDKDLCVGPKELKIDETMKILGLTWNKLTDTFGFTVNLPEMSLPITKRKVISDIARLFDPLGWIAPAVTTAKILIQKMWLSGTSWDQELPTHLRDEWIDFRKDLPILTGFEIPRWVELSEKNTIVELHGFCDASSVAFAAAVYLRVVDENNVVHVNLVTSKTKVAPIKQISIPRLELCGAVLVTRLLKEVSSVLNIPKANLHAWTDSTIVLAWLNSHPNRWKVFVANRVSEILTSLDSSQWSHVSTSDNPADCASRGTSPGGCVSHELWKKGPKWLYQLGVKYGKGATGDTALEEQKGDATCLVAVEEEDILSRFSSLVKLTRVIAYCRRVLHWRANCHTTRVSGPLSAHEIEQARVSLVKLCQANQFHADMISLRNSNAVPTRSRLKPLYPFLDKDGVLRVGGRLANSKLGNEQQHPAIIPHEGHFTALLIDDAHKKTLHGGIQLVLNYLRAKYWIISAKGRVRQQIRNCVVCARHAARHRQQLMGQLPQARVTIAPPFYRTGVDYAGPISMRTTKGRGHHSTKGYICLFVCMCTKAIHLEAVSDFTSEGFLAAFKRFVARRGPVSQLWSDNGTNFVGSAKELKHLFDAERSGVAIEVQDWMATNGTTWNFLPPYAPNFGGLWERGVRSTKGHLARILGTNTLTYEELSTVLAQIEATLNSRPLTSVSTEVSDPCPLTPGHFLIGRPLVLAPDFNYEESNVNSLKRWQLCQKMVQDFWRRWSKEYLTSLVHRYKWSNQTIEPQIGDVVLVQEDGLPPARWLFGLISEKHTGADNLTRVVSLRCKGKTIKRPVNKLIILPVGETVSGN